MVVVVVVEVVVEVVVVEVVEVILVVSMVVTCQRRIKYPQRVTITTIITMMVMGLPRGLATL